MKIYSTQKGFTLIEMIVVLAIFAFMTTIVLFNYNKFTNETILTNMAYETALSIREAQIYGISVRDQGGAYSSVPFGSPYGVHFIAGANSYNVFADVVGNGMCDTGSACTCPATGNGECRIPYTFQRNIKIGQLKIRENSTENNVSCVVQPYLSVQFRRPNPEAIIQGSSEFEQAEIMLEGSNGSKRYVVVNNSGQIYVDNETICPIN